MDDAVQVEAARIPDRDRLLQELRDAGLEADPVDELGIDVAYPEGEESASAEIFERVEHMIMSIGAPFVPTKHDGVIYIRPPLG